MSNNDVITTAINEWLLQYEPILDIADVHTEELPDDTNVLSLQRSGVEPLANRYITEKGWNRQYQYILLLKNFSESDLQRLTNIEWLDDLSRWVHTQKVNRNMPEIEGMTVYDVSCANAITYETDEEGAISTYYIQLYFNIKGGN